MKTITVRGDFTDEDAQEIILALEAVFAGRGIQPALEFGDTERDADQIEEWWQSWREPAREADT